MNAEQLRQAISDSANYAARQGNITTGERATAFLSALTCGLLADKELSRKLTVLIGLPDLVAASDYGNDAAPARPVVPQPSPERINSATDRQELVNDLFLGCLMGVVIAVVIITAAIA